MKRAILMIVGFAVIIFLIVLSRSGTADIQNFYGIYTFDKLIYLTPLSSSTLDYANKAKADTKYIIEVDLFKMEGKEVHVEISSPTYVKEEVQFDPSPLFDDRILKGNRFKCQYGIKDKDGNTTKWRLYVSMECLFVASYHYSPNGTEVIWEIARLSK